MYRGIMAGFRRVSGGVGGVWKMSSAAAVPHSTAGSWNNYIIISRPIRLCQLAPF